MEAVERRKAPYLTAAREKGEGSKPRFDVPVTGTLSAGDRLPTSPALNFPHELLGNVPEPSHSGGV